MRSNRRNTDHLRIGSSRSQRKQKGVRLLKRGEGGFRVRLNTCAPNGGAPVQSWPALLRVGTFRWSYRRFYTLLLSDPSLRIQHLENRQHSCGTHALTDSDPHKPYSMMHWRLFKLITIRRPGVNQRKTTSDRIPGCHQSPTMKLFW